MTQILGFAGKKQSGKNTACNYILALKLAELGVSKNVRISQENKVEVTDIFGEEKEGEVQ
jgi:molybdopterin-guanine dinucleotide biosynthesis protein